MQKKAGRPKSAFPKQIVVGVRLSDEEFDLLTAYARHRNRTVPDVMRQFMAQSQDLQNFRAEQRQQEVWRRTVETHTGLAQGRFSRAPSQPLLRTEEARLKRARRHAAAPARPGDADLMAAFQGTVDLAAPLGEAQGAEAREGERFLGGPRGS